MIKSLILVQAAVAATTLSITCLAVVLTDPQSSRPLSPGTETCQQEELFNSVEGVDRLAPDCGLPSLIDARKGRSAQIQTEMKANSTGKSVISTDQGDFGESKGLHESDKSDH